MLTKIYSMTITKLLRKSYHVQAAFPLISTDKVLPTTSIVSAHSFTSCNGFSPMKCPFELLKSHQVQEWQQKSKLEFHFHSIFAHKTHK